MSARTYKMSEFKILTLCAGRTADDIAAALNLWDERGKVVEKLKAASSLSAEEYNNHGCWASMEIRDNITAALALLQAEKEGDA